jgi:hypothetical protein
LHQFPVASHDDDEAIKEEDLYSNEDVVELFISFNGYFTHQECYNSLKFNSFSVADAAAWLVEDGESERGTLSILKSKSTLLCQSEIVSEQLSRKNDSEIVVAESSLLNPSCITTGRWTLNKDYVSYHLGMLQENDVIHMFSINQKDLHILNSSKAQKQEIKKVDSQFNSLMNAQKILMSDSEDEDSGEPKDKDNMTKFSQLYEKIKAFSKSEDEL